MKICPINIIIRKSTFSNNIKYLIPKRITLKENPPIFRWLCFIFSFKNIGV